MNFLQFFPNDILKPFVECYWIVEGDARFSNVIIPDGYPEMIFHYRDPYAQESGADLTKQPLSIAAGQLTQPLYIRPLGATGVLGVKFKPAGFWKLFGINMEHISNKAISFDDVTGIRTEYLLNGLQSADTHGNRVALVEGFLLQRMSQVKESRIDGMIDRIEKSHGHISVAELCADERISLRTVERAFNESIGISAKRYIRLMRFKNVYKLLQQSEISKADAACICGYFDQSHFNMDFKTFSGEDPGRYFSRHHPYADFFMNR